MWVKATWQEFAENEERKYKPWTLSKKEGKENDEGLACGGGGSVQTGVLG